MTNAKQYIIIGVVALLFVGMAIFLYFIGIKSHNIHYIRLEVNPKIELLTDKKNKVTHIFAENAAAKELLIDEQFIGLNIEEACTKFVDLCVQANYIDVSKMDNAVQITVVSGAMQVLEMKVFESLDQYFLENQIFAIISENDNDIASIKEAKEKQVSSVNKLTLIKSVINQGSDKDFKTLNTLTETELLEILKKQLDKIGSNSDIEVEEIGISLIANKSKRIDFNRVAINEHKNSITPESSKIFAEKYEDFKRLNTANYDIDYEKSYNKWVEKYSNYA